MRAENPFDVLIVGQGLAGSLLAWTLLVRGVKVCVVDRPDPSAASRVAAGLLNPVTGFKLVKIRQADAFLPLAREVYGCVERALGRRCFHLRPMARVLVNEAQRRQWEKRCADPRYAGYLQPAIIEHESPLPMAAPLGWGEQRQTGFLDTGVFLDGMRDWLAARGSYLEARLDWSEVSLGPQGARWQGLEARWIISCEGDGARDHPWFSWLPLRSVKGQILDLRFEQALPERILNRGVWLLPLDRHRARFGATYERGERDTATTPEARAELLERLAAAGIREGYGLLGQRAGVRPGTVDRMPVMGLHPRQPALGMFNGFGSKGVIMMPFFARAFADYLCEGRPLPGAVDLQRFWSAHD